MKNLTNAQKEGTIRRTGTNKTIIILFLLLLINTYSLISPLTLSAKLEQTAGVQKTANIITDNAKPIYIGTFSVTAYCSCSKCCGEWANNRPAGKVLTASGKEAKAGRTIAVAPHIIPYGTKVIINGAEYVAEDRIGQQIINKYNGKCIDIYFNDHSKALKFGRRQTDIYIYP